jgi:plastocyanin
MKRVVFVLVAASVISLAGVLPAQATIRGPQSTDVSCDAVTVKAGESVIFAAKGTYKIGFNSSVGGISDDATWFTARSSSGNDLAAQARVAGQTATWTNVAKSTYTARFVRRFAADCNSVLPGHGNYTLNYTITYPG